MMSSTTAASFFVSRRLGFVAHVAATVAAITVLAQPAGAQSPPAAKPVAPQSGAAAAGPASTTATYGDWLLRCVHLQPAPADAAAKQDRAADAATCEVVQTVQMQGQHQPIAQIAIGRLPNETALTMTAVVPSNVSLPGMIHISGNGKTGNEEKDGVDLTWTRCVGGACFAATKANDSTLTALRAGSQGALRFMDASGQTVSIPLSWKGLDQAIKALPKAM